MRYSVLFIFLLVIPLLTACSCPPTAGYVGAIYEQGSDLKSLMNFIKESGISAIIEVGNHSFSPYGNITFPSIYLRIGSYEEGGELRAYVLTGSKYTLLMVETDSNLSESPLLYAESLLSPYLDPSLIVNTSASPNNWVPPVPLAEWYKLEKAKVLPIAVYKCGFAYSKMLKPELAKVGLIANSIDRSLSFGIIREAFESRGVEVDYLGSDAGAVAKAREYRVVIFLGGHKAAGVGRLVTPLLAAEVRKVEESYVIVERPWGTGGLAVIIAGADRYETRKAAEAFAEEKVDEVLRIMKGGEPVKKISVGGKELVELISSHGKCGYQEEPSLEVKVEGGFATATYRTGHANPCGRFTLSGYNLSGKRIEVRLSLVDTASICIQCVGLIEAELRIGPLTPGSYELCVNGLCRSFEVRG